MAFDFPASPTSGQQYAPAGGPTYQWDGTAWKVVSNAPTAQTRSRIVNGAMQISQEWDNAAIGPASSLGYYSADQWQIYLLTTVGTITAQRVQSVTPNGSRNRIRATVGTAKATMAAGDQAVMLTAIEGIRVADFQWGSASARQVVLRFGWKSPAGTYGVSVQNGPFNRSYVVMFTVAVGQANTDTTQTFVIPGDVTGTWPTDTATGMYLGVTFAAGSSVIGVAGWQAGGISTASTQTNGMATAGNVFELFDVGLYLDPDNTGLPPKWQMPDEAEELRACQRYWHALDVGLTCYQRNATDLVRLGGRTHPVRMRTTPAMNVQVQINYTGGYGTMPVGSGQQAWEGSYTTGSVNDSLQVVSGVFNARM